MKRSKKKSLLRKKNWFCFMDEAGNTGLNHFDSAQDFFIQGCLLSRTDLDNSIKEDYERLVEVVEKTELHGKELGEFGINRIANDLVKIIQNNDLKFLFTVIDKKYFVKLMFFHLVFDPGVNEAVYNYSIASKPLRMVLAFNFIQMLSDEDGKRFWEIGLNQSENRFVELISELVMRVDGHSIDKRSKELITDALNYAIVKPGEIITSMKFDGGLSANVAAFTMTINGMNNFESEPNTKISKIVHDEQNEFAKYIAKSFNTFSSYKMTNSISPKPSEFLPADVFLEKAITFKPSKESIGLQIIDLVLWTFKRVLTHENANFNYLILKEISDRSYVDGISFNLFQKQIIDINENFSRRVFTDEDKEKIKKRIELVESSRWKTPKKIT